MNIAKGVILGFVSLVCGLWFGMSAKIMYESSTFHPYDWDVKPIIANCYGNDFSELQMRRAMGFWRTKGFKVGNYIHYPKSSICESEWTDGYIILRKSNGLPDNTLASTRRYTTISTMRGAVIKYKPGSQNLDMINEHELGHALGLTHCEEKGHIMHPDYEKMGILYWLP